MFTVKNWVWDDAKYELTEDLYWDSGKKDANYESPDGYLIIKDGIWRIKKGFKWNGTSGVPDGPAIEDTEVVPVKSLSGHPIPKTWRASLVHDCGCTYVYLKGFPYKRKDLDKFFYEELKKIDFSKAELYYYGVRLFSTFLSRIFWFFERRI